MTAPMNGTEPNTSVTPEPAASKVRKRWLAYFGANSMALSILLHIVFGVGATYLVVQHFTKKHVNFNATEPPSRHTEVEHKVELAKKNNVESAPPDVKRIVTTGISAITLPDVPEVATRDEANLTTMSGIEGTMGMGMGAGSGAGGGGGGGSPLFGAPTGLGFEGTLYDLKQTSDQKPNKIANNDFEQSHPGLTAPGWGGLPSTIEQMRVLRAFVANWNMRTLDEYYEAPVTLRTPQIFIPKLPAREAPKAFGVEKTVQPRRWIVLYKAKITPPASGEYRFIGFADDYLVVRIDGRNVLDASWEGQKLDPKANVHEYVGDGPDYTRPYAGKRLPLSCGQWVDMHAGIAMDMQVMIGEGPGGESAFFLMVQQKGVDTRQGDYPVFQLQDVDVPNTPDHASVPFSFSNKKMVFGLESK